MQFYHRNDSCAIECRFILRVLNILIDNNTKISLAGSILFNVNARLGAKVLTSIFDLRSTLENNIIQLYKRTNNPNYISLPTTNPIPQT